MIINEDFIVQIPVWVKLPSFPLEYWNEEVFAGIAKSFGELLSIDPVTVSRRRLIHARICVVIVPEVDMPKQIEMESKLGKWVQKLEYEMIPFSCFKCKKARH